MTGFAKFALDNGDFVVVEVEDDRKGGLVSIDKAKDASPASSTFEEAVSKLKPITQAVMAQLKELGPHDVSIELAVKFAVGVGVILARTSSEGTCKVTIGWRQKP